MRLNSQFRSRIRTLQAAGILAALTCGLSTGAVAQPANDNVLNATPLTVDVPFVFDNVGATVEAGEPNPGPGTSPPAPTCDSQDGWCSFETAVQNSVWFTFVAPVGSITIAAGATTFADLQLALWDVGDPTDFLTFTEVAANDDGGPIFAPLITPISLVPNRTYYVQVDGFAGTTTTGDTILVSLTCPCFDAAALSQPPLFGTCQALGPWSGGYTQYLGWPFFSGETWMNGCWFSSPFAPDVIRSVITPDEYQVCRQTLLDAAANAGVSCLVW